MGRVKTEADKRRNAGWCAQRRRRTRDRHRVHCRAVAGKREDGRLIARGMPQMRMRAMPEDKMNCWSVNGEPVLRRTLNLWVSWGWIVEVERWTKPVPRVLYEVTL